MKKNGKYLINFIKLNNIWKYYKKKWKYSGMHFYMTNNFYRYMENLLRFKQIYGYKMDIFWNIFFTGLHVEFAYGTRKECIDYIKREDSKIEFVRIDNFTILSD